MSNSIFSLRPKGFRVTSLLLGLGIGLAACGDGPKTPVLVSSTPENEGRDVHTQSNGDKVILEHLRLDLKVDFDQRLLSGKAEWTLQNPESQPRLRLDTDGLRIDSVWVDGEKGSF